MSNLNFDVCLAHFYKLLAETQNGLLICIMVIKWPLFASSKNATLSLNTYISANIL